MTNEKKQVLKWEIKDVITVVLLSLFLILNSISCKYGMHGESFRQYGFINRHYDAFVCTGVLFAFVSGKKALCYHYLYEYHRHYIYADGELVSFSVFCCSRRHM